MKKHAAVQPLDCEPGQCVVKGSETNTITHFQLHNAERKINDSEKK